MDCLRSGDHGEVIISTEAFRVQCVVHENDMDAVV